MRDGAQARAEIAGVTVPQISVVQMALLVIVAAAVLTRFVGLDVLFIYHCSIGSSSIGSRWKAFSVAAAGP